MKLLHLVSRDLSKSYLVSSVLSFTSHEVYCGVGTFTAEVSSDFKNELLKNGNFLLCGDFQGVIENIAISRFKITINGYTLNALLNNRVAIFEGGQDGQNIETAIYAFFNKNKRGLNINTAPIKNINLKSDISFNMGDKMGNVISSTLEGLGLGYRVVLDMQSKTFTFEIYQGNDLTDNSNKNAVVFSIEWGNMKEISGNVDTSNVVNAVFVFGEFLDGRTMIEQVSNTDILADIKEGYLESDPQRAEETNKETGEVTPAETDSEFKQRLIEDGKNYLYNNQQFENFDFVVLANDYGKRYKIGDLVYCRVAQFNLELKMRVAEYQYSIDRNGDRNNISLGLEKRRRIK